MRTCTRHKGQSAVSFLHSSQDGPSGSGKTLCMDQVIHWCVKAGWLVLQIPKGEG